MLWYALYALFVGACREGPSTESICPGRLSTSFGYSQRTTKAKEKLVYIKVKNLKFCERILPKLKKNFCIFHIPHPIPHIPHIPYIPYIPYPIYPIYPKLPIYRPWRPLC